MNTQKDQQAWEEWRPVVGFDGKYEVSSIGRVKSLYGKGCILKPSTQRGYFKVNLKYGSVKAKNFSVHRLVALAFVPIIEGKLTVNHINGIKSDNRAENLEWLTIVENLNHAVKNNLAKPVSALRRNYKTTPEQVLKIRELSAQGIDRTTIAKIFNIHKETVSLIKNRKRWNMI